MSVVLSVSFFCVESVAVDYSEEAKVIDFVLTNESNESIENLNKTRASGLIYAYGIDISKNGTTLLIAGETDCISAVVKCGFKNLTVERRKTSSDSWEDYYEYGNVYADSNFANLSTSLSVASGYQYRVTCKHYAKKSLLVTQSISNTSNIVII